MALVCGPPSCPLLLNASCVFYEGANLIYTGINTNDSIEVSLEKIENTFAYFFALDNNVVHRSGVEIINDAKTFTSVVTAPGYASPGGTPDFLYLADGTLAPITQVVSGGQTENFNYKYSTSLVASDPGIGYFRFNNSIAANITAIYLDNICDITGFDISTIFQSINGNWSIYIQQTDDASKWIQFNTNVPYIDNTGWWTIPVLYMQSSLGGAPSNNKRCTFYFINRNASTDIIVETILDGDTTHVPSSNAMHDALQKKLNIPTGFITGLQLSINVDNTKFDIAAGAYAITDFSDIADPDVAIKIYPQTLGITPAYLGTANASYIALDTNMMVIQSSSPFENEDRRVLAILGAVIHSNNININVVNEIKAPVVASINQLHDFMKAVGSMNLSGNIYSANGANLMLNKSSGVIFGLGINANNYLNPHELTIPAQIAFTFAYRIRTGTQYANTQFINPNSYDLNGVLTAIPPGNRWTIQHINLFQSGLSRIQFGQALYNTFAEALAAINTEQFVTEQNIADNAIFRSYLIIKRGTTDLAAALAGGEALFVPVDKFGNVIGNGSVALTYANIVAALGYVPEDVANKAVDFSVINDILYPSVKAVDDQLDLKLDKGTYTGNAGLLDDRIEVLENLQNLQTNFTGQAYAIWSGVGLIYNVTYPNYYIQGVPYPGASVQVTLDPSDLVFDRKDIIVVGVSGAYAITGVPEATPVAPTFDSNTEIYITTADIAANATTPSNVSEKVVYKENVEFTTFTNSGSIVFNGTTFPFQGIYHIDCSGFTAGNTMKFTEVPLSDVTAYSELSFFVNLKAVFANTARFYVRFLKAGIVSSSTIEISSGSYNFNRNTVNIYQQVIIPMTAFSFTSGDFNGVEIFMLGSNLSGFRMDNIVLSAGPGSVSPEQKALTSIVTGSGVANATVKDDIFTFSNVGNIVISAIGKVITFTVDLTNYYTKAQVDALIASIDISQITITTSVSITTATLDGSGVSQKGKHVLIDNGVNPINITVNGGIGFIASYEKLGTGAITFIAGAGRTLNGVDGTLILNGAIGSTAALSCGIPGSPTKDNIRISNA